MNPSDILQTATFALTAWTLKTVHEIAKRQAVLEAAAAEDRSRIIAAETKLEMMGERIAVIRGK
jgi:hypothetical protein